MSRVPYYLTKEQGAALAYAREVLIATRGVPPDEYRVGMGRCQSALTAVLCAFSSTFQQPDQSAQTRPDSGRAWRPAAEVVDAL